MNKVLAYKSQQGHVEVKETLRDATELDMGCPVPTTLVRIQSGTFLVWGLMALAAECEKMTGALAIARTSDMTLAETCDKSTIIPKRFISKTIFSPKSDMPTSFPSLSVVADPALQ